MNLRNIKHFHTFCSLILLMVIVLPLNLQAENIAPPYSEKELNKALSGFQSALRPFNEGKKLFAEGQLEDSAREFKSCVSKLPQHIYAHFFLSNIHYIKADHNQALIEIIAAEKDLPFMQALDDFARAQKIRDMDDVGKGLATMYENTDSCRERMSLDEQYLILNQEQEKLREIKNRALFFERTLKSTYATQHGAILFQLKEYKEALRYFILAVTADPENGKAHNNIIAILHLAGHHQQAYQQLQVAQSAGAQESINLKLKVSLLESLGLSIAGILEQEYSDDAHIGVMRFTNNVFENETGSEPLFINSYLVFDRQTRDAILIDPGVVDPRIQTWIDQNNLTVRQILNTHGHRDHCQGNLHYARLYGVKIGIPAKDLELYHRGEGQYGSDTDFTILSTSVQAGCLNITVTHTPGHTVGSVCFHVGKYLLSGDSLFDNTIGKIDSIDSVDRQKKLRRLIDLLKALANNLPEDTLILPGHGRSSSLDQIRKNNPYMKL